mmetsp:Transcript_10867/g.35640  ORF Transcript_10867/g.35640 Transcript_10867/m.35640 type:complete len:224 (-) Transcript_10867:214-885(-)
MVRSRKWENLCAAKTSISSSMSASAKESRVRRAPKGLRARKSNNSRCTLHRPKSMSRMFSQVAMVASIASKRLGIYSLLQSPLASRSSVSKFGKFAAQDSAGLRCAMGGRWTKETIGQTGATLAAISTAPADVSRGLFNATDSVFNRGHALHSSTSKSTETAVNERLRTSKPPRVASTKDLSVNNAAGVLAHGRTRRQPGPNTCPMASIAFRRAHGSYAVSLS